jgi:5'-nucleotidase
MVDAMAEKYSSDVAFINTAGVRDDIKVGNIKIKKIYNVFPFDNLVVLTTMKGSKLKSLIVSNGSYLYFNSDFDAKYIEDSKDYAIATIDFVFTSPNYKSIFSNSIPDNTNILMRDVFIEYLEGNF